MHRILAGNRAIFFTLAAAMVFANHAVAQAKNQGTRQDCEQIKKDITDLQEQLPGATAKLVKLREELSDSDRRVQHINDILKKYLDDSSKSSLLSGSYREEVHERILEDLRKTAVVRRNFKKSIDDLELWIRTLNDLIADLLNKLGNCGSKTTPSR